MVIALKNSYYFRIRGKYTWAEKSNNNDNKETVMPARIMLVVCTLFFASTAQSQTFVAAGGKTIRSTNTEHDAYRAEINFGWKPELWSNGGWVLSLNHALSVMTFRDENTVNAISWAPNLILTSRTRGGLRPFAQLGFGVAYLSDDKFQSEPVPHPMYFLEGNANMGSHGQFESSLAVGLAAGRFFVRAKVYHYSNAGLADKNDGMDVAELGIGYRF